MQVVEDRFCVLGVPSCSFEERQRPDIVGGRLTSIYPEAVTEPLPPRLQELADAFAESLTARKHQHGRPLQAAE